MRKHRALSKDSNAVSVFVAILVELHKYCISISIRRIWWWNEQDFLSRNRMSACKAYLISLWMAQCAQCVPQWGRTANCSNMLQCSIDMFIPLISALTGSQQEIHAWSCVLRAGIKQKGILSKSLNWALMTRSCCVVSIWALTEMSKWISCGSRSPMSAVLVLVDNQLELMLYKSTSPSPTIVQRSGSLPPHRALKCYE